MKLKLLLPWICVVGLICALGVLYSANQRQAAQLAQLTADNQELENLQAAKTEANPTQGAGQNEELIRLRKENENLLRLRNEVRQLREEKQKLAKQTQGALANSQPQPSPEMQQLMIENQQLRAQTQQIQQTGQATGCMNNLRQIEAAKQQWALENQRPPGSLVGAPDVAPYLANKTVPICPAGGVYTLNPVAISPICSFPGHALPK